MWLFHTDCSLCMKEVIMWWGKNRWVLVLRILSWGCYHLSATPWVSGITLWAPKFSQRWEVQPIFSISFGSVVKNPPANAGDRRDVGLIPGLIRSPAGGSDNPLHYSCLENSMDRGAWCAIIHGWQRVRRDGAHTHTHTHTRT